MEFYAMCAMCPCACEMLCDQQCDPCTFSIKRLSSLVPCMYCLLPTQPADVQDLVLRQVEVIGGLLSAFPAEQHDWTPSLFVGHQLLMDEVRKQTPDSAGVVGSGVASALAVPR